MLWRNDGKLVRNAEGNLVRCEECPCGPLCCYAEDPERSAFVDFGSVSLDDSWIDSSCDAHCTSFGGEYELAPKPEYADDNSCYYQYGPVLICDPTGPSYWFLTIGLYVVFDGTDVNYYLSICAADSTYNPPPGGTIEPCDLTNEQYEASHPLGEFACGEPVEMDRQIDDIIAMGCTTGSLPATISVVL